MSRNRSARVLAALVAVLASATPWLSAATAGEAAPPPVSLLVEADEPLAGAVTLRPGLFRLEVPAISTRAAIATLSGDPRVRRVRAEPTVRIAAEPDDPLFPQQWHLRVTQVADAHDYSRGAGVRVAVLDTGVTRGPDLACHAFGAEYDAIARRSGPGEAADTNGHGTHVAGVLAQCTDNSKGAAGVAPGVTLLPVRVLDAVGGGRIGDVIVGLDWAVGHGAQVVNLSFGMNCYTTYELGCRDPALDAAIADAVRAGVLLVAANGNAGRPHIAYPANHPDVIAVGAHDEQGLLAPYSNRGPGASLTAPGGRGSQDGILQESFEAGTWGYRRVAGTSMASPQVAGAAALMRSIDPTLSSEDLRAALESTAADLGAAGYDSQFGHGSLRVRAAVETVAYGPQFGRFRDVPPAHLFVDDVAWLAGSSITKGCDPPRNQHFCPGAPLTRGELAAFFVRAFGLTATSSEQFTDVPRGHLFHADISKLAAAGITKGCNPPSNTRFCPDAAVTRDQFAAFLARAVPLVTESGRTFTDVPVNHLFRRDIDRLATAGVTKGCNPPSNTRFCPADTVTRGQFAAFLHRALG